MENKKNNILTSLVSIMTYKKPKVNNEFYISQFNNSEETNKVNTNKSKHPRIYDKLTKKTANFESIKPSYGTNQSSELDGKNSSIGTDIDSNLDFIRQNFYYPENVDIIIRKLKIGNKYESFIVYIDGMADKITINDFILRPLLNMKLEDKPDNCPLDAIFDSIIETDQVKKISKPEDIINQILTGQTGIYIDGCDYYIFCETTGYEKRGVEKPRVEGSVKGAQEAFSEDLRTNITLVRRIIKNNNLITELFRIGERNHTECAILYLNDLANPYLVEEVKRRIKSIKTDFISGDGMLEQFIEDDSWSIISTILSTERPDRTTSHIAEGKVIILVQGTPFALIVPVTIFDILHASEDYSIKWQFGLLMRIIRVLAIFSAMLLPGIYVSLTNFHPEMIPSTLLISIAKSRESVPFPTIVEVIFMESAFELIREAGIRIPGIIGNTIGIVGALILGQSAVQANLVSPILIIIIAVSGLSTFALTDYNITYTVILIRVYLIFLGALFGFYGLGLGLVSLMAVFSNIKSFGVPILAPLIPKTQKSNDTILKHPIWEQELRPDYTKPLDTKRQPKISRQWKEFNQTREKRNTSKVKDDEYDKK